MPCLSRVSPPRKWWWKSLAAINLPWLGMLYTIPGYTTNKNGDFGDGDFFRGFTTVVVTQATLRSFLPINSLNHQRANTPRKPGNPSKCKLPQGHSAYSKQGLALGFSNSQKANTPGVVLKSNIRSHSTVVGNSNTLTISNLHHASDIFRCVFYFKQNSWKISWSAYDNYIWLKWLKFIIL